MAIGCGFGGGRHIGILMYFTVHLLARGVVSDVWKWGGGGMHTAVRPGVMDNG